MRLTSLVAASFALSLVASQAFPQTDDSAERATLALRATPVASLPPMMTPAMISRQLDGAQLAVRYGLRLENDIEVNAIDLSAVFLAGLTSSVTVTAGALYPSCNHCSASLQLGASGDMRLGEIHGAVGPGTQLSFAIGAEVGYAQLRPTSDHALAAGVSAPVTLSLGSGGQEGLRIVPYVVPMLGFGETSNNCASCDESGTRFVLGGGLGVWNPMSNWSASIGISQVFFFDTQPVYGVNVIIGGAR